MTDDAADGAGAGFFAPPPFRPAEALLQLQRTLRGLGGLTERGNQFLWKGRPVVALAIEGEALQLRIARRPAASPEWESRMAKNAAELRRFGDDVKLRVARWKDAED